MQLAETMHTFQAACYQHMLLEFCPNGHNTHAVMCTKAGNTCASFKVWLL